MHDLTHKQIIVRNSQIRTLGGCGEYKQMMVSGSSLEAAGFESRVDPLDDGPGITERKKVKYVQNA